MLDPWNGSGTTTYAAAQLGHSSIWLDLNPVMVIVARARLLSPSEADLISATGHPTSNYCVLAQLLRVCEIPLSATQLNLY